MAELDQTARCGLKMAPEEPLRWMLPNLSPDQAAPAPPAAPSNGAQPSAS